MLNPATITALFTGATGLVVAVTTLVRLLQHERDTSAHGQVPDPVSATQVVK